MGGVDRRYAQREKTGRQKMRAPHREGRREKGREVNLWTSALIGDSS